MPLFPAYIFDTSDIPRLFRRGVRKYNVNTFADETTTTSGVAIFYLTDDKTATGIPLFTENPMCTFYFDDPTADIGVTTTLSGDFITLTVTMKKQLINLVTVLGISVVGSITMANITNGTVIDVYAEGK